jgi:hypothetical protein
MTTHPNAIRTLSLDLPGGRVLHLALSCGPDGLPSDLTIAAGDRGDLPMLALCAGASIPAGAVPILRDVLAELEAEA